MSNGDGAVVTAINSEPFWNYWLRQSPFLALACLILYFVGFHMVEPNQKKQLELMDKLGVTMDKHAESNAKNATANVLNAETNAKNADINRQNSEQLKGQAMILEDIRAHVRRGG